MGKKEEMLKQAVQKEYLCNGKQACTERAYCRFCEGENSAHDCDYECYAEEFAEGFLTGWDAALKSQWISTEERMPEPNTDVIFLTDIGMIMNGCYDGNCWMQMDGVWGSAYSSINKCWKVIAWMPNPSFDNVLKNK